MKKSSVRVLKLICVNAMLMALSVVIGIVCKNFFTWSIYYRVTFENLPVIIAGFCFGPVWGAAVGVGADIVSCLMSTNPAVNPIISLGAATVGILSGLMPIIFRRLKPKLTLILSVAFAHIIGQVLIKSIGKIIFYGMPKVGILVGLAISLGVGTVEYFIILLLLRTGVIRKQLRSLSNHELY